MENIAAYIRDGKFYDISGQEVPIEIGNREQIDLVKKGKQPLPKPSFSCTVSEVNFEVDGTCHCGGNLYATKTKYPDSESWYEQDENEIAEEFRGTHLLCRKCKQEYVVDESEEGDFILEKYPPLIDRRGIIIDYQIPFQDE